MELSIGNDTNNLTSFKPIEVKSLSELSELIQKSNYSLSTFKNNYRNKSNFLKADFIGLDFDGGYSLEKAKLDFAEYMHIIAPTKNHGKDKNGVIADRFRVILVLEYPITDNDTFESTWFSLFKNWPQADSACKDASRFFYPSVSIASSCKGKRIPITKPQPKPVTSNINQEQLKSKGTLARNTLDFLVNGAAKGKWNSELFKAAVDFNQQGYTESEALNKFEVMKNPYFNGQLDSHDYATIKSAFAREAKHEPRIKTRAFRLMSLDELYKTKSELSWLVDGLLTSGGVSLMSSDPKAGKSTLVRQLMRDVLRGSDFLGRKCKQGQVHYYGIEEQIEVVNASFRRLGLDGTEDLLTHIGDALNENKLEDFREILLEKKPVLAVIDTLFDFLDVESENNYKEVKRELRKIRAIARESGTHILLVHHNSKGQKDDKRRGNRGILGSQAIAGGVDTIMVIEVEGKARFIATSGREIRRWDNNEIIFNDKDCTYSLGSEREEYL